MHWIYIRVWNEHLVAFSSNHLITLYSIPSLSFLHKHTKNSQIIQLCIENTSVSISIKNQVYRAILRGSCVVLLFCSIFMRDRETPKNHEWYRNDKEMTRVPKAHLYVKRMNMLHYYCEYGLKFCHSIYHVTNDAFHAQICVHGRVNYIIYM